MANTPTNSAADSQAQAPATPLNAMAAVAISMAWLIPGAGHLIQKKFVRGLLIMVSVIAMFSLGMAMNGKIYRPNTGDLLDMLGFIGDIGAGGLYILSRIQEWGDVAIAAAASDYGTKYIVVAGLLNLISVVDAYHIAIGKKQ